MPLDLTLCTLLIRSASLLTPVPLRLAWREEWIAELTHAHARMRPGKNARSMQLLRFAVGAFSDAWDLRLTVRQGSPLHLTHPQLCFMIPLVVLAALTVPSGAYHHSRLAWAEAFEPNSLLLIFRSARVAGIQSAPSADDYSRWRNQSTRAQLAGFRMNGGLLYFTPEFHTVLGQPLSQPIRLLGREFNRVVPLTNMQEPLFVLARTRPGASAESLVQQLHAPNGSVAVAVPVNAWATFQIKTAALVNVTFLSIAILRVRVVRKVVFLLCATICWQILFTLVWLETTGFAPSGDAAFTGATLVAYLLASGCVFTWAHREMQWRCPICAAELRAPVQIGFSASVILEPSGTELLCPSGHGSLYAPDYVGSATGATKWIEYDATWREAGELGGAL